MNSQTIYRHGTTKMFVKIINSTDYQVKLSVVSGIVHVADFWVSRNFFDSNFSVCEGGQKR